METFIDRKKMQLIASSCRKSCKTFTKRSDWFIRIKVNHPIAKTNFISWLTHREKAESYQVALEGDNETNWHVQAVVKFRSPWKDTKSYLSTDLKEWYKTSIDKNPKLKTYYSCVRIRENPIRALAYNMKEDREVVHFSIKEEDIELAKMLSHGKDLRQLSKKLESLKERYFKNHILSHELTEKIILLKAEFNQSIYINRIEAMVRYIMIKKHPVYAKTWATRILERIKDGN